jgi:enamine deaminase RidA (YjgF/YER057c/UK114 family)
VRSDRVDYNERDIMAADRLISSGSPYEPIIGYSRATVCGDYVHVSGSTATVGGVLQHEGDAYGQAKVALETVIAGALAEVGYALEDVVRTRVYCTTPEAADGAAKAHGEVFGQIRPATVLLSGLQFVNPAMLVEIEVDAWKRS